MKVSKYPCHLCAVLSTLCHLAQVGEMRCERCKKHEHERCYCHKIHTAVEVTRMSEALVAALEKLPLKKLPAFVYLQKGGIADLTDEQLLELGAPASPPALQESYCSDFLQLKTVSALIDDVGRPHHIDSDPLDLSHRSSRTKLLRTLLHTFGALTSGEYSVLKGRLLALLKTSYLAIDLIRKLAHSSTDPTQLIAIVEKMVPCLLHMKKNTHEPLVTLWLNCIYDASLNPHLTNQAERKAAVDAIVVFINKEGLGKMEASRQWNVQFLPKGAGIDRISLEIYRGEAMARKIGNALIDMCVSGTHVVAVERRLKMKEHFEAYLGCMDELNKPFLEDGGGDRIFSLGNKYFDLGVQMWGRAFIGNYSHIIGSGHALWFMENGLFLKVYEQQSIEAFVKLMKQIWFNKTSRGGGEQIAGEKRGKQRQAPRIKRVFQVTLRRYGWYSGRLQQFFDADFKRACEALICRR